MSTFDENTESHGSTPTELGERLIVLIETLRSRIRPSYHTTRLTAARMSALRIIIDSNGTTGGQIAQAEQVTPATITRVLDGLAESGFISREPSRSDRRIIDVNATEAGIAAFRAAEDAQIERLAGEIATLNVEDRASISRALRHLEHVFRTG